MANTKELVSQYRGKSAESSPVVPNEGLAIILASELEAILKEHPDLQITRKPLPRGATGPEIYEYDLLTEAQKTQHAGMPNYETNVAGVKVPFGAILGHLFDASKLVELVILSTKR